MTSPREQVLYILPILLALFPDRFTVSRGRGTQFLASDIFWGMDDYPLPQPS